MANTQEQLQVVFNAFLKSMSNDHLVIASIFQEG